MLFLAITLVNLFSFLFMLFAIRRMRFHQRHYWLKETHEGLVFGVFALRDLVLAYVVTVIVMNILASIFLLSSW
jgi:hypothetical protein